MTGWAATNTLREALHDACWAECRAVGAAEHEAAARERDVYFAKLALVETALDAAEKVSECEDYWDWVTAYAPALKAALRAVQEDT